jgi:hypothetical protein
MSCRGAVPPGLRPGQLLQTSVGFDFKALLRLSVRTPSIALTSGGADALLAFTSSEANQLSRWDQPSPQSLSAARSPDTCSGIQPPRRFRVSIRLSLGPTRESAQPP